MRTGRLLKLTRGETEVHVYLFREGAECRAAVYLASSRNRPGPEETLVGPNEAELEAQVRRWVDERFPRGKPTGGGCAS
jgi:hypothetical protein